MFPLRSKARAAPYTCEFCNFLAFRNRDDLGISKCYRIAWSPDGARVPPSSPLPAFGPLLGDPPLDPWRAPERVDPQLVPNRTLPRSCRVGPDSLGLTRSDLDNYGIWPNSARVWPTSPKLRRHRSSVGRAWVNIGRARPDSAQLWPSSAQAWQTSANFGRHRLNAAKMWPHLANLSDESRRTLDKVDPMPPIWGWFGAYLGSTWVDLASM